MVTKKDIIPVGNGADNPFQEKLKTAFKSNLNKFDIPLKNIIKTTYTHFTSKK